MDSRLFPRAVISVPGHERVRERRCAIACLVDPPAIGQPIARAIGGIVGNRHIVQYKRWAGGRHAAAIPKRRIAAEGAIRRIKAARVGDAAAIYTGSIADQRAMCQAQRAAIIDPAVGVMSDRGVRNHDRAAYVVEDAAAGSACDRYLRQVAGKRGGWG
jgi:hypothetical protein